MFKKLSYGVFAVLLALVFTACKEADYGTTTKTLTGITLNTASVKKDYVQYETLNLSGLAVTANYSDGSGAPVTNYTANPANGAALNIAGQITVKISYTEGGVTKTAEFIVNVNITDGTTPYTVIFDAAGGNGMVPHCQQLKESYFLQYFSTV